MMTNDWRELAFCRGADTELFFPVGDGWAGEGNAARAERAKEICAQCPVRLACANDALDRGDDWAILGGLLPDERRVFARMFRVPA